MKNKIGLKEYRVFFDEAPEAMFILNPEGEFLLVNKLFCETTGYTKVELSNMSILDTYFESEIDLFAIRLASLNIQKKMVIQRSIKRKDGSSHYAQISATVLENGWLRGIVHNLSVTTAIERTLEKTEERFRQIAESIRDVFFLIDLKTGNFLYVSPAYETIWKQSVRTLLIHPSSWMDSIHPDDRKVINDLYRKNLKTGLFDARYRIILADNSIRWVHVRTYPVYNDKQQLYRSVGVAEDVTEFECLLQKHQENIINLHRSFHEMINALSKAIEQRDAYTAGHQSNVARLAVAIAKELKLSEEQQECIEIAAQIHDIGKINIPSEILTKPTKLSYLEFELIKTHAQTGYDILRHVHFPWPIADIVWEHHERLDGSGYPRGLKENEIRFETKIISVADTVDAMSSHRPYRPSLGLNAAISEIHKFRGIRYDKKVVDVCEKLFHKKPAWLNK